MKNFTELTLEQYRNNPTTYTIAVLHPEKKENIKNLPPSYTHS